MTVVTPEALSEMSAKQAVQWRDPAQIISQWEDACQVDPRTLEHSVRGAWWKTLADCGITLLVTREYEHLVMAMTPSPRAGGVVSYMRLPHPSGIAVDRKTSSVYIAATRNPNQVFQLRPVAGMLARKDSPRAGFDPQSPPLVPVASRFYPGCLYIHDLAMIDGSLYANAVGQNTVVRLNVGENDRARLLPEVSRDAKRSAGSSLRFASRLTGKGALPSQQNGTVTPEASWQHVWWPKCIERNGKPVVVCNYLQLNSIAAGSDLESSYFSASADRISRRRPGHLNFPVDRRGVIFSGKTREPIVRGLTRPHSARLLGKSIWVANSGYGELGFAEDGKLTVAAKLPGWTRGLCFCGNVAFVGTSRVIPKFRHYAPGLDVDASVCGIHAVDTRSGKILGSIEWPWGNQIFAIDFLPRKVTGGFLATVGKKPDLRKMQRFFYAYSFDQKG